MKIATQNKIRAEILETIVSLFTEKGEDVGQIESNAINFPIVSEDGEEGFVEIWVKMPKGDGDDQFLKRDTYKDKEAERAEREAEKEKAKAEKIAKAQAKKQKEKEE